MFLFLLQNEVGSESDEHPLPATPTAKVLVSDPVQSGTHCGCGFGASDYLRPL